MADTVPEMKVTPPGKGGGIPFSVIWVVPLVAVAIALFIAWQSYAARGPLIHVHLDDATGIVAGQTELRFRSLKVGVVEKVHLNPSLTGVVADIRVDKEPATYIDADAQFWLVEPEVSAQGVRGLDTVLTGVFIQAAWDDQFGEPEDSFEALPDPPLAPAGTDGTVVRLRAEEGGRVQGGAPVVFRGVTVGSIDTPVLADDGSGVTAHAFIRAPYDRLVNSNTRFWATGGVSVNVGPAGLTVDVANLASLIQGGVTFGTVVSGGRPVETGMSFDVYADRATARESIFAEADADEVSFSAVFEGAIAGLTAGAPVELAGLRVGQVTDLGAFIDPDNPGEVKLRVDFTLRPGRLGLEQGADTDDVFTYVEEAVAEGLHAQLANAGILSSDLKVELVRVDDRAPGTFDRAAEPYPTVPALPVDVADMEATAEGIVERLTALPVEDVMDGVVEFIDNINKVLAQPSVQELPADARALLADVREKVNAFDVAPLMADLQQTAGELRALAGTLATEENRERVAGTLASVESLAGQLDAAAAELPGLMQSAQEVTQVVASLDLNALVAETTGTLASVRGIVEDPETRAIPGEVQALVADARVLLGSDAVKALPSDLSETLAAARAIVDQVNDSQGMQSLLSALERVDTMAADLQYTIDGLPALRDQISEVIARAAALPLEETVASAQDVLDAGAALLSSEDTADLPGALNGVLGEMEGTLSELRAGGTVESVNETLASAREASAAIADAAESLPELSRRLEALVSQADALMAAYGERSVFNASTLGAINDLREAARAVTSLSRTIERNPSSLIRGR